MKPEHPEAVVAGAGVNDAAAGVPDVSVDVAAAAVVGGEAELGGAVALDVAVAGDVVVGGGVAVVPAVLVLVGLAAGAGKELAQLVPLLVAVGCRPSLSLAVPPG